MIDQPMTEEVTAPLGCFSELPEIEREKFIGKSMTENYTNVHGMSFRNFRQNIGDASAAVGLITHTLKSRK